MARRYTRDNRGRFSSVGATARGGRLATASGNKRTTQTAKLSGGGPKGTVGKPKGLKPGAITERAANRSANKAGSVSKPDASLSAISRRRARAMADRASIAGGDGFNMKLSTRSAVTRSAANAIYNRQRQVAKAQGGALDRSVVRDGIGVVRGLSGSPRDRAGQLREQALRRVKGGRRK